MTLLKFLNKIVDAAVFIILLLLFLYAGYCLWDNNQLYAEADKIKI